MKNLYWRDGVLWCSYPLPGYPSRFSLKIKNGGSKEDKKVCEKLGSKILDLLRTRHVEGKLFEYREFKDRVKHGKLFETGMGEAHKKYNPKFWRIVGRYWYYHLRHRKSGQNDRYHLQHCLKKFGKRYARDIQPQEVTQWLEKMKDKVAVNTINLRLSYMQAAYNYANEREVKSNIGYNPTKNIQKFKGANIRSFLLTPEMFERNYSYLYEISPSFALYYLALWETGRRPAEVAQYTWDMYDIKSGILSIPARINKTDQNDFIPLSTRLHESLMQVGIDKRKGLMFPGKCGNPYVYWDKDGNYRNNNTRYINLLKEKFGDAGVIRDTRRGFVTRKVDSERQRIEDVMLLTGHTTYTTIKRYRIGSLEAKRRVIESTFRNDLPENSIPFSKAVNSGL